jgi:hypothetical protein
MKKILFVSIVLAVLAGCSTTKDKYGYDDRADVINEKVAKGIDQSIDKAPDWYMEPPKNTASVAYAVGSETVIGNNIDLALAKAKMSAYGTICMNKGGETSKSEKLYQSDTNSGSVSSSERAIKATCNKVDIVGVESVKKAFHRSTCNGGQSCVRAYALIALPIGEANIQQRTQINDKLQQQSLKRKDDIFNEMDSNNRR